jgi:hypothetical protein
MELWTAFLLGLGGSLHCVGMCGPLALALPGGRDGVLRFAFGRLCYNGGRIITYALLGGVIGMVGGFFGLAGVQQYLSVGLGITLLLSAILWLSRRNPLVLELPFGAGIIALKGKLGGLLVRDRRGGLLLIGLLNGLLPCGLVYMGLVASLATGGLWQGMAYMAVFGAGTLPLMLATVFVGRVVRPRQWQGLRQAAPFGLALLGVLLVLRGLSLDIPFVSPILQEALAGHHH